MREKNYEFPALAARNNRENPKIDHVRPGVPRQMIPGSAVNDVSALNHELAELNRLVNLDELTEPSEH